jgi:uncharacterized Fe-S cluster protein YjdI
MRRHISIFGSVLSFLGGFTIAGASENSYFCYRHQAEGMNIDINPAIGKLCIHSFPSDQNCTASNPETFNLSRTEPGQDSNLQMGYSGYFAEKAGSMSYFRVYAKPFFLGDVGSRRLVYKAVMAGTVFDKDIFQI